MAGNRVRLRGSERTLPPGAELTGVADPQQQIRVTLVLRHRSPVPDPSTGERLSRAEFASRHGAHPADVEKVRQFAEAQGLRVVETHHGRRSMILEGTVADMTRAFETELKRARIDNREYRVREGALTLPSELDGVIEGVFGLDTRPQAHPHFRRRSPAKPAAQQAVSYAAGHRRALPVPHGGHGHGANHRHHRAGWRI